MPKSPITKINPDMCAHEVTRQLAIAVVNWNRTMNNLGKHLDTLEWGDEQPDWAEPDCLCAMLLVAVFQAATVHLAITRDERPEHYELAKSLYETYGLTEVMSSCIADFVASNDSVKKSLLDHLKAEINGLPWEVN